MAFKRRAEFTLCTLTVQRYGKFLGGLDSIALPGVRHDGKFRGDACILLGILLNARRRGEQSVLAMGQGHFVNEGSLERKRRGKGTDQTKSRLLAFPKVRKWLRSGWRVSRGFLPHSFTQPYLPPQSKEVHLSVLHIQNVFFSSTPAAPLAAWPPVGTRNPCCVTCLPTLSQPCALAYGCNHYSFQRCEWGQEANRNKWPALLWPSFWGRTSIYSPSRAGLLQGQSEALANPDHRGEMNSQRNIPDFHFISNQQPNSMRLYESGKNPVNWSLCFPPTS